MITFRYLVSILKPYISSYQLPFNQFTPDQRICFLPSFSEGDPLPELPKNALVFGNAEAFLKYPKEALSGKSCYFLANAGSSLSAFIPHTINYIAFHTPFSQMLNLVIEPWQQYQYYNSQLSHRLLDQKQLRNYMNLLFELTGMYSCLYNDKQQVLLQSEHAPQLSDEELQELCASVESRGLFYLKESEAGIHAMILRRMLPGRSYDLVLYTEGEKKVFDLPWIGDLAMDRIVESISDFKVSLYPPRVKAAAHFTEQIMSENMTNWEHIRNTFDALFPPGSEICKYHTVLYISTPPGTTGIDQMLLLGEISHLFPDGVLCPYEQNIVMYVPNPDKNPQPELHGNEFVRILEKYNAFAGCALWTQYRFRTAILNASAHARLGQVLRMDKHSRVFYYNEYNIYNIIDLAADRYLEVYHTPDMTYLIHPAILRINAYDKEHNSNLLEILYYYLRSGCSVNDTATALKLHRNTVQGKLSKIDELIFEDYMHSGVVQCQLMLSCMLFFYQNRYSRTPFRRSNQVVDSFKGLE